MSNRMTINQVAKELNLSTKTLRRWEESKFFVPERDPHTNIRLYHPYVVSFWKKYIAVNKAYQEQVKKLRVLHKKAQDSLEVAPSSSGKNIYFNIKGFNEAEEEIAIIQEESMKLLKEIMQFPRLVQNAILQMEQEE